MSDVLIPVTILTGFLGAGKTTLLNRLLQEQHGHRIAVIENEYGEVGIDNQLLVHDTEQIVEMNNGCICCTVRGDLQRALLDLATKRDQGKLSFERVIIETTGLADPGPVAQTFFFDETVAKHYLLDAVLTVVDAKHAPTQLDRDETVQKQVAFADRILFSKLDLVDEASVVALEERLTAMNPRATFVRLDFGAAPVAELLDLRGFNLNARLDVSSKYRAVKTDALGRLASHLDSVQSFVFRSERAFDLAKLEVALDELLKQYGTDLYRYKGILYVAKEPRQVIFQGVHMMMGSSLGRRWNDGEKKHSLMVFIGRHLPQAIIEQELDRCLLAAKR